MERIRLGSVMAEFFVVGMMFGRLKASGGVVDGFKRRAYSTGSTGTAGLVLYDLVRRAPWFEPRLLAAWTVTLPEAEAKIDGRPESN